MEQTVAQPINSGSIQQLNWDTTVLDEDSMVDLPNNRIVASTAGNYQINAIATLDSISFGGRRLFIALFKNGVEVAGEFGASSESFAGISISSIVSLEVGDTLDVRLFHVDSTTRFTFIGSATQRRMVFSGHLITSGSGGSGPVSYSLTEQETGQTWLAGETVYQKTFQGTTSGLISGTVVVPFAVTGTVTRVIAAEGAIENSFASFDTLAGTNNGGQNHIGVINANGTQFNFEWNAQDTRYTNRPFTVTLTYIKS